MDLQCQIGLRAATADVGVSNRKGEELLQLTQNDLNGQQAQNIAISPNGRTLARGEHSSVLARENRLSAPNGAFHVGEVLHVLRRVAVQHHEVRQLAGLHASPELAFVPPGSWRGRQ
jgi:hypothetical protein